MPKFAQYLLIFLPFWYFSQSIGYFDSLKILLTKLPNDTRKVNILNELAFEYLKSDSKISRKYTNEASELAILSKSQKHISSNYNNPEIIGDLKCNFDWTNINYNKPKTTQKTTSDDPEILGNLYKIASNAGFQIHHKNQFIIDLRF